MQIRLDKICSDVRTCSRPDESAPFRANVRLIWDELVRLARPVEFSNTEGGSVEQQRDRRLQLHHCANYAAVLTVLMAEHQRLQSPLRLLEIGCGSGGLAYALARVMPKDWTIEATDYSERLLERARARLRCSNLSFRHLDARSIGKSRLQGIDAVLLLEVIEHLPQPEAEALLRRVYDALPSHGMITMTTLDRAAFPRPFSGYAPHFVEYTYRSLGEWLKDPRRCPFEEHRIYRLVSERIASESARAEERGGYLVNRLKRLVLGLGRKNHEFGRFQEWLQASLYRLYAALPRSSGFDLEDYLNTLDFDRSTPELHDHDSFGLVAVLKKAGRVTGRKRGATRDDH